MWILIVSAEWCFKGWESISALSVVRLTCCVSSGVLLLITTRYWISPTQPWMKSITVSQRHIWWHLKINFEFVSENAKGETIQFVTPWKQGWIIFKRITHSENIAVHATCSPSFLHVWIHTHIQTNTEMGAGTDWAQVWDESCIQGVMVWSKN